jgi:hypothetical protein
VPLLRRPQLVRQALAIVAASKHLAAYPWGEAWAREVWSAHLDMWTLGGEQLRILVPGEHRWAIELAERVDVPWVELGRDGVRRSSDEPEVRWAPETVHPHALCSALIESARAARHQGWEVEIVALRIEGRTSDDGLGRLLHLARAARLEVDEYTRHGIQLVG